MPLNCSGSFSALAFLGLRWTSWYSLLDAFKQTRVFFLKATQSAANHRLIRRRVLVRFSSGNRRQPRIPGEPGGAVEVLGAGSKDPLPVLDRGWSH